MSEGLRRELGLAAAGAIVVGTVIGSGIFLVPSEMVRGVGSPGMVFIVWVVGGLLSLFGALTYAELAAAMPEAGGEYVYLREAYGPFFGFIYAWTQTLVAKSASIATIATGFYLYSANFWPRLAEVAATVALPIGPGGGPLEIRYGQLIAMALILGLGVLNYFGVKVGGNVQIAVTVVKVGSIVAIVVAGLLSERGSTANLATVVAATGGMSGFMAALLASLWAYDGWNNVSMVASEIKRPQRNLPFALVSGTAFVAVLYISANLAYFYLLPSAEVAASERVAGDAMRVAVGPVGADLVAIAAMISMFAALNGSILAGSRVPYAMARDGYFFARIAHVHPKYATPAPAIMLLSSWAALLVLSGHYRALYTLVLFPSWILYAMATASVIVLRRKRPDLPRPYRTIGYPLVPLAFVLVAIVLLVSTLRDSPRESLLGLLVIVAGIPYYRYRSRKVSQKA